MRIPQAFLDEERRKLGNGWFEQEYLCEFTDNGTAFFGKDMIEHVVNDEIEPLEI